MQGQSGRYQNLNKVHSANVEYITEGALDNLVYL